MKQVIDLTGFFDKQRKTDLADEFGCIENLADMLIDRCKAVNSSNSLLLAGVIMSWKTVLLAGQQDLFANLMHDVLGILKEEFETR